MQTPEMSNSWHSVDQAGNVVLKAIVGVIDTAVIVGIASLYYPDLQIMPSIVSTGMVVAAVLWRR